MNFGSLGSIAPQQRNHATDEVLNRSILSRSELSSTFERVLASTRWKQKKANSFTAIVQRFRTHISDRYTARARIPAPSVRAEESLRPLEVSWIISATHSGIEWGKCASAIK